MSIRRPILNSFTGTIMHNILNIIQHIHWKTLLILNRPVDFLVEDSQNLETVHEAYKRTTHLKLKRPNILPIMFFQGIKYRLNLIPNMYTVKHTNVIIITSPDWPTKCWAINLWPEDSWHTIKLQLKLGGEGSQTWVGGIYQEQRNTMLR